MATRTVAKYLTNAIFLVVIRSMWKLGFGSIYMKSQIDQLR